MKRNRLTLLLEQHRQTGVEIVDLTQSNPTKAGLSYPSEKILEALADPRSLSYDPHPQGMDRTRGAVVRYYSKRGQMVAPEDLLLTTGTSEAYSYLFKLLADPHDNVLVPQPSYPLFEFLAAGESVNLIPYPLVYQEGWHLDLAQIHRLINSKTRALIVVHPNNPTGSFVKPEEWVRLSRTAAEFQLPIICDEVFFDYLLDQDVTPANACEEGPTLTFILNGLSKVAGLPQMKLGWVLTSGPENQKRQALRRLELIADTFLSVSAPVQHAAARFLKLQPHIRKRIQQRLLDNLEILRKALSGGAIDCLHLEGGWYAILRMPETRSDEEWALELLSTGQVLVHRGYFYDFAQDALLVISLLTEKDTFEEGLTRLLKVASDSGASE